MKKNVMIDIVFWLILAAAIFLAVMYATRADVWHAGDPNYDKIMVQENARK